MGEAGKVEFHHGVADKLAYACRLLRKAYRAGARVVVTGDADALKALDRQLWVFDEQEFVPHVLALSNAPLAPRLHDTPIWLTDDPEAAPGERAVLVNVGQAVPAGLARFPRLFEVVGQAPEDRQAGRQRWKAYAAMGWQVQPHEVKD
jgi:DNA polymerase-3 subunit chi